MFCPQMSTDDHRFFRKPPSPLKRVLWLWIVNCVIAQRFHKAKRLKELLIVNSELWIINCQLSIVNYQLSIMNYELSIINCQLWNARVSHPVHQFPDPMEHRTRFHMTLPCQPCQHPVRHAVMFQSAHHIIEHRGVQQSQADHHQQLHRWRSPQLVACQPA